MYSCTCIEIDDECKVKELSKSIRTANKKHKCIECGEIIKVGQKYEYVAGICDGKFQQYKTCDICVKIRNEFIPYGWYYGLMWSDIHQVNCEDDYCICPPRANLICYD